MASFIGSSSAWGSTMVAETASRTIRVLVPGWVLDDRSLAPPSLGDVVEVLVQFIPSGSLASPIEQSVQATARPVFGRMPGGHPDGGLRWLLSLFGDGWSANWWSERPVTGAVEVTGRFVADLGSGRSEDDPVPVRGRVRRVRVVEQRIERTDNGARTIPGTERFTDFESTPQRFWSTLEPLAEDEGFSPTGVLVDLDLDDVPACDSRFVPGAMSIDGPDVWVMDRSNPILLHLNTRSTPPRITEYLLPMTIESPGSTRRNVHSDPDGCWITSHYDLFRCDRAFDGTLTVERVSSEGGAAVVDDGRLFILGVTKPVLRIDRRHGLVRVDPDAHPVKTVDQDRRLIPVDNPEIAAALQAKRLRVGKARAAGDVEWRSSDGQVIVRTPDGKRTLVDLDVRTRGVVSWVQPDPFTDPS
ncbi:hypothetical protein [Rhodococcus sp. NPDC049939]|uniref:hypothetical protein n=1 Tax=Rhodococcus sp. NPDC049939 TaxID=3155511 RepID=UPI0033C5C9B4